MYVKYLGRGQRRTLCQWQLGKLRVFDANGELRTYSADGDGGDVELFRAVSAGFGCFGVVYDVTIQVWYSF